MARITGIGGVFLKMKLGDQSPAEVIKSLEIEDMGFEYEFREGLMHLLIYSDTRGARIPAGNTLLFRLATGSEVEIVHAEASDYFGSMVNLKVERGALPIVLGGEHSVTIGAVEAAATASDAAGRSFSVLQVDAHADTRESYHGSRYNHACVMARAREHGPIVQVGIRAIDASERPGLDEDRVIWAHEIAAARARADTGWMDRAIDGLVDDVWLTIDLDAFDPSFVPATGTPEPGGLDWYEVNALVRRLVARRRLVGFDVVELLPQPGQHASDFLAARLVYRVLAEAWAG